VACEILMVVYSVCMFGYYILNRFYTFGVYTRKIYVLYPLYLVSVNHMVEIPQNEERAAAEAHWNIIMSSPPPTTEAAIEAEEITLSRLSRLQPASVGCASDLGAEEITLSRLSRLQPASVGCASDLGAEEITLSRLSRLLGV